MTLVKRERLDVPELMRRFLDVDWDTGWLRLEEFRDGDVYVIRVELPGVDPDKDVEISVEGDMMHIRAKKQEKSEHKDKDGYRSEFRYGSFVRDLLVPPGTKAEAVKASYDDGVLEIRVPFGSEADTAPTKVKVTRG